jgi:uncharacterized protein YndB with AHSA1/START domain
MTSMTEPSVSTTQVYRVYIKATPEAIWDAITSPEWTARYGYGAAAEYDLRPGGAYRGLASAAMKEHGTPDVVVDGQVVEVDAPHRLVQTWRFVFDEDHVAEDHTRLTWEIAEVEEGLCRLTVTHELDGAPKTAEMVAGEVPGAGGGWAYVLSDLKTLLETGRALEG